MKRVLFSGKAESGKSTAAETTKDALKARGYKVIKLSYGDYVKYTAKMLFGWDGNKDEAGRTLLQWWGTDKVRAKNPHYWVDTVIRLVDIISDMYDYVIIDDVRYPNEITRWTGYDTFTVRVERPGHENSLTPEQRAHASETSLDNYDFDVRLIAATWDELVEQVYTVLLSRIL